MTENYQLREMVSVPFHEKNPSDEFREFAELAILPSISIKGYKRLSKRQLATNILHNLVTTGLTDKVVADSRDSGKVGVKARTQIWDEIIKAGYAIDCKGSEMSVSAR